MARQQFYRPDKRPERPSTGYEEDSIPSGASSKPEIIDDSSRMLGNIDDVLAQNDSIMRDSGASEGAESSDQLRGAEENPSNPDYDGSGEGAASQVPGGETGLFNPSDGQGNVLQRFGANINGMSGRNKALLGGGAIGITIGLIFLVVFSLLPLKINHIVQNTMDNFYGASEDAVERRSEVLLSQYLKRHVLPGMKVDGICNSTRTIDRTCIADIPGETPSKKLFRGWRDARLENRLADKYGVEIVKGSFDTRDELGRPYKAQHMLKINGGKSTISLDGFVNGQSNNVFEVAGNRSEIRRAMKDAFKNETRLKRTLYRFKVGTLLERKYGIRRCLFACKVVDAFDDWKDTKSNGFKQATIRRVITPRTESLGVVFECLFTSSCGGSPAPDGEDNERRTKLEKEIQNIMERVGKEITTESVQRAADIAEKFSKSGGVTRYAVETTLTKIFNDQVGKAASKGIPVVGWIDTAATVLKTLKEAGPTLKRAAYVMNAAAMVHLSTMVIAQADELKNGRVDPALLGSVTAAFGSQETRPKDDIKRGQTAETSPLYSQIMGSTPKSQTALGSLFPSVNAQAEQKNKYTCDNNQPIGNGEVTCPEEKLGLDNAVTDFSNVINSGTLAPLGAAADAWNNGKKAAFGTILDAFGSVTGWLFSNIPFFDSLQAAVGKYAQEFMSAVAGHFIPQPITGIYSVQTQKKEDATTASGIGILSKVFGRASAQNETNEAETIDNTEAMSGARTYNMLAGGIDVAANDFAHYGLGGSLITDQRANEIRAQRRNEEMNEFSKKSMFARIFDKNSRYSVVSSVAMSMPLDQEKISSQALASAITKPFSGIFASIQTIFSSKRVFAATDQPDPFNVPQFAVDDESIINADGDIYTPEYCKVINKEWAAGEGRFEGTIVPDPITEMDVHTVPNPCALEDAAVTAAGGFFTDEVIADKDLREPGQAAATHSTGGLASGDLKDLATKILASPNVSYESNYKQQMESIAGGDNLADITCGRGFSEEILGFLATLSDQSSFTISSLVRPGTCAESRHAMGCAVDIALFNGSALDGTNDASDSLINAALAIFPGTQPLGFGIGSGNRTGINIDGRPVTTFEDNANHVHIDLRC